jgi:hypothetical protein
MNVRKFTVAAAVVVAAGCGSSSKPENDEGAPDGGANAQYVLASVVLTDEGRTTYVQVLPSLSGHVTNEKAVEIAGNGAIAVFGRHVFVGLAEEPTWVRYTAGADGTIRQTGRISFMGHGLRRIDFGNAIVDAHTAVSVSSEQYMAIVWDPEDLVIKGTIDLAHLKQDGYELEVWTTIAHDGLVYVPGRWANWTDGRILPRVSLTILDPRRQMLLGTAESTRCASGGRPIFARDGYAYVMGDGRNYSIQMYANARGEAPPKNCLLRIGPGKTEFDPEYHREISSLTGGHESASELETVAQGSGIAFTKLLYPEALPAGVKPDDFEFWEHRVFKAWQIDLGDDPQAKEVAGLPFSALGFEGSAVDGKWYTGESPDYSRSVVYEVDPAANTAKEKFSMDGLFYALRRLE